MSREEEEREVLRAVGVGAWRNACAVVSPLALEDEDICIDVFLMPPIPMVLRCSFLFLSLASLIR